ncbi:MAG: hypothetical protein JKY22_12305 [Flavobacteriaceae bacterium]|nr:hypothetical protein [Flavobacteriaceae bacterium]
MGELIKVDFSRSDDSGYVMDGSNVDGVYVKNLCAVKGDVDVIMIGEKVDDGVDNCVQLSIEDMNTFCIMWLAINNPDVIKYDEEVIK